MDWLTENWFWILIFAIFIGMHLFGHGGHGSHCSGNHDHNTMNPSDKNKDPGHHHH